MKTPVRDILRLADRYGYHLTRQKRHLVFTHPSGAVVVCGKSASCHHALCNIDKQFRRSLPATAP
jgi:predicted RNA binding protein YcfA (HicA-like mRNA interferase family)